MRNLILLSLATIITITSCKKSETEKVVSGITLDYMEVQENLFGAHLYLYGSFGDSSTSSKVKISNTMIDGNPVGDGVILQWTPYYIKISIGDPDDDAGAGYVSVFNKGIESNKRMLNVWELSLLYRQPDEGTILKEVRFNALLRADAGSHKELTTMNLPSSFSSRSEAFWAIGGQGHSSYTGGGITISLEDRSGMVIWSEPYEDNTNEPSNFQSEVRFKKGKFELSDLRMHKLDATLISNLADGSPAPFVVDYDFRVQVLPLNDTLKFELDENKAIKAGQFITGPHGTQYDFTWDAPEAPNHMHHYTLEWEKATARFNQ